MMRRRPLTPAGPQPSGKPVQFRAPVEACEQLHREADEAGASMSDLIRERIDAAVAATPDNAHQPSEFGWLSARLSQEQRDALEFASAVAGIGRADWLRLVTTSAGAVLFRQLQAVHGGE